VETPRIDDERERGDGGARRGRRSTEWADSTVESRIEKGKVTASDASTFEMRKLNSSTR
jgi:hypothetical protein